jgi:hypothetical protein
MTAARWMTLERRMRVECESGHSPRSSFDSEARTHGEVVGGEIVVAADAVAAVGVGVDVVVVAAAAGVAVVAAGTQQIQSQVQPKNILRSWAPIPHCCMEANYHPSRL